jgi:hypothetical protein
MHFRIENPTPAKKLGLPPGAAKEVSHEEMSKLALAVSRIMAPVAQRLVNVNDEHGQGASKAVMGLSAGPRVHCFVVDEGKDQEISSKDLLELYAEDIKARKAARAKNR